MSRYFTLVDTNLWNPKISPSFAAGNVPFQHPLLFSSYLLLSLLGEITLGATVGDELIFSIVVTSTLRRELRFVIEIVLCFERMRRDHVEKRKIRIERKRR